MALVCAVLQNAHVGFCAGVGWACPAQFGQDIQAFNGRRTRRCADLCARPGHLDHVDGDHVAFRKVQVIPGAEDFGYVEVNPLEDLTDDTQIVVAGAYFLMAESKKGEEGGGHSHSH